MRATPITKVIPVAEFLTLTAQENSGLGLKHSENAGETPCSMPVEVGLFFDGTNNNMERDLQGKRIPVPLSKEELKQAKKERREAKGVAPMPTKAMKPEECCHTNVVKLYSAFVGNKQDKGYFRYYIPGVGTAFKEIGEPTESANGKAFADGGQERITWGLLQVLNALHMLPYKQDPLYSDEEVGKLAQAYDKAVGNPDPEASPDQPSSIVTHQDWFAPHIAKLKAALAAKPKPKITKLNVSVFGFSRGAAQAAAFSHLFHALLEGGELAGIPASIRFLGLFDIVASVGGSASMAKTLPLPGRVFDGHWAWGAHILKPLPSSVANGLHLIAAHELRMNFPVTHQNGNIDEVLFPGVHSDIGGGYAPGTQGKGRGAQAALLSQIPLAHMYKAARLAGVPLKPFGELAVTIQDDFEIAPALASAWDAYVKELGSGDTFEQHMKLYYRWRAARLDSLESTASFAAADAQEQEDLRSSNRMLAGDLKALRQRRSEQGGPRDNMRPEPFSFADTKLINHWQFYRAQHGYPLDEWEQWALKVFDAPEPLPPEVMCFFDDYVHDSFAGFYMAGEVTEFDKRARVAEVMEKPPNQRGRFERKIAEMAEKIDAAKAKREAGETLTDEEQKLLASAEHDTPYPVMTDDAAPEMRNSLVTTQTYTRREGGGYVIHRGRYPAKGFQLRGRKTTAETTPAMPTAQLEKEAEFAWRNEAGVTEKVAIVTEYQSTAT